MTQHELIIAYCEEFGSIIPAKCYGKIYKDQMFGSETSKRARELRAKGILVGYKEGKFEKFYLKSKQTQEVKEDDFDFEDRIIDITKKQTGFLDGKPYMGR